MEKPALLCSENVDIKWYNQLGSGLKISYKLNIPLYHTLWLILLLGTDQREIFKHSQNMCTQMFIETLLLIAPNWTQSMLIREYTTNCHMLLKWATTEWQIGINHWYRQQHGCVSKSLWMSLSLNKMNVWVKELLLGEYILYNSISVMFLNEQN